MQGFLPLLAILALVRSVLGQCSGPSISISTNSDADAIASCSTYNGDIIIASTASGTIELQGVQQINGDLICGKATQLTALRSDSLTTIGGTFSLNNLAVLSTLEFGSLNAVNHISWTALPALQSLSFAVGISRANSVIISNTQLDTLSGLSLAQVGSLDVNNNPYLSECTLRNLTNITTSFSCANNAGSVVYTLPNLASVAAMTFRNASAVSMPLLSVVKGNISFYSLTDSSLSLPQLTSLTGGSFTVADCASLTSLRAPLLSSISGDLTITNNRQLDMINGFTGLRAISGTLRLTGTFDSLYFPTLSSVGGDALVETTSTNNTICNIINNAKLSKLIQGSTTCSTNANKSSSSASVSASSAGPQSTNSEPTGSNERSSSLSGGALAGIVIGAVVVVAAFAGATWFFCIRRRRQPAQRGETEAPNESELPLGGHHEKTELPASTKGITAKTASPELEGLTSNQYTRMDAKDGYSELHTSSRISGPTELAWDQYHVPELEGSKPPF